MLPEPNPLQSWLAIVVVLAFVWGCVVVERWWNRRREERRTLSRMPFARRAYERDRQHSAPRSPGRRR